MECKLLENQVYIGTNGEYRFCCISQESGNKETVWTHTPEQWLNSETVKSARDQLAENKWPDACIKCKKEEEAGFISRRLERQHYGPGISHLDLRLGNSCNLKCVSCWSGSSSSINEEAIEMTQKGIIPLHPVFTDSVSNWYDEKFFSYFNDLPVKEVALAGGEPMMIKHLPEFLDGLDSDATVRITTNGTIYNPKLVTALKRFKKIIITVSVDAIGKRIEYIRYGTKWNELEKNIKIYSEFAKVDVSPCISVLNAAYYDEIMDWATSNNLKIYQNLLMHPEYLHIKNAPDSLKEKFKYFENWKLQPADHKQQKIFFENITKLDKFRNINIKDYLPEVAHAYGIG